MANRLADDLAGAVLLARRFRAYCACHEPSHGQSRDRDAIIWHEKGNVRFISPEKEMAESGEAERTGRMRTKPLAVSQRSGITLPGKALAGKTISSRHSARRTSH